MRERKRGKMYRGLKKRVMSLLLAVAVVVSGIPMNALADYTANADKTVYEVKNGIFKESELIEIAGSAKNTVYGYSTDGTSYKRLSTSSALGGDGDAEKTFANGTEVYLAKYRGINWEYISKFTVRVYDELTVTTTPAEFSTIQSPVKVYRDTKYELNVADKSADGYTVTVSGAVEGTEAKTYEITGLTDDAEVTITYVADTQSTINVNKDDGVASVVFPNVVNADNEFAVKATPAENKYISSISLLEGDAPKEWTSKNYIEDRSGAYEAKYTAASTKTAYVLDVVSAPILSWKSGDLRINYNEYVDSATAENTIKELLNAAEGIDKSKLTIKYKAKDKLITEEIWQELGEEAPRGGHAFGTQDNETIRVSYTYDSNLPQYQSTVIEANISVSDDRVTPTVQVKSNVQIGYKGTGITKEEVLNAVFDSVTAGDTKILTSVTNAVSITDTLSVWAYKKNTDGQYNVGISGAIGSGISSVLVSGVVGDYKVVVAYAGDKDYTMATAEAYFSVYDDRLTTTITTKNASVDAADLGNISYDEAAIKSLLVTEVKDENNNALENNKVEITSVWCTSENSLGISVPKTLPLTAVGEYTVYFEYPDTETHKKSDADAKLTIRDARPTVNITLKEDVKLPYTKADPLTEQQIYKAVIQSMMVGEASLDTAYIAENVSLANGEGTPIEASGITEAGNYKITVKVPDANTYKGSEASVWFTVTDGRNVTSVNIDENKQIPYNFADGLSKEDILKALSVSVKDTKDDSEITEYTVKFFKGDTEIVPADMKAGNTYQITVAFAGNDTQAPSSKTTTFEVVDARAAAVLTLKQDASVVYKGEKYTDEEILTAVFESLTNEDGTTIETNELKATAKKDVLNVGSYEVTVKFAGNENYKPTSATTELTVTKADATVNVTSKNVNYKDVKNAGVNVSDLITTDPLNAGCIEFAVGIGLGEEAKDNAKVIAYVNLPKLIDVDSIKNEFVKETVESILAMLGQESTMTVSKLKETLESVLAALKGIESGLEFAGIKLDTASIEALIKVLESIENIDGIKELTVKLTMGEDILVKDTGVYITGGVISDSNFNTAANVGYLLIVPDATKVELAFNVVDNNGIITRNALLSGSYDMGSHVVEEGLSAEAAADAMAHLKNLYIGIDINGTPVISDTASAEIGAYTQIAFIYDLGNEMYYAVPIVRAYAVVADTAIVKFVDENNNENNDRIFTYDGNAHGMTAIATDRQGNLLSSENISYRYIGLEGDIERYYSSEAPSHAGAYTVIATYLDADHTYVGMAVGAMVIKPAEATMAVEDLVYIYDGNPVDVVEEMITKTPDDAKMTVVTAGIKVDGDFSQNKLEALGGSVNVDFPDRIDEILKNVMPQEYENGITIDALTARVTELQNALDNAGLDTQFLDKVLTELNKLSGTTLVTFQSQSEVKPTNIGAYLVAAIVTDPDYETAADTGILLIAPKVTTAELNWRFDLPENKMITRNVLSEFDFSAFALNSENVMDETLTNRIQYLYIGMDTEGNSVVTRNKSDLKNGVYTEIAYILDKEVSADMTIAKPILRTFAVAAKTVDVKFLHTNTAEGYQFVYGKSKPAEAAIYNEDGSVKTGLSAVITYSGMDSQGKIYRNVSEAPKNAGVYAAVAVVYETAAPALRSGIDHDLEYVGMAIASYVITPAESGFEVKDTKKVYDGKEKFADIENPNSLEFVAVVVDQEKNVNILLPESWGVKSQTFKVAEEALKVLETLKKLPTEAQSSEVIKVISEALSKLSNIKSVSINGSKPIELGTYHITGIAFGSNYKLTVDAGNLEITKTEEKPENKPETKPENKPESKPNTGASDSKQEESEGTLVGVYVPSESKTPEKSTGSSTGDNAPIIGYTALIVVAGAALLFVLKKKRKTN